MGDALQMLHNLPVGLRWLRALSLSLSLSLFRGAEKQHTHMPVLVSDDDNDDDDDNNNHHHQISNMLLSQVYLEFRANK